MRTLELVDIPSESRYEASIREHLLTLVSSALSAEYARDEAFLFVPPRRHDVAASDMKAGVAVALELVRDLAAEEPGAYDVALLLFGREELGPERNPLPALFDAAPSAREAALAILLEPTDGQVQAG